MRTLLLALSLLGAVAPRALAAPSITEAVNMQIKDLRASADLGEADLDALRKIGKDYANAYRCKTMETYFKEPGRIRFEMRALGISFTYVINGNVKYSAVPQLGICSTSNIASRPETRQNSMEIGFLTPSALKDFTARYLRFQKSRSHEYQVYELRYKLRSQRGKKIILRVDPEKKVLVRRELYNSDGSLKVRFDYLNPVLVAPGIWVPTRITVHNAQMEFGGATTYRNIRVNTGLPESLFRGI